MIIPDHADQIQDPLQHLWGLLTEIGEQQNQNRNIALSLHTQASGLRTQAIHSQNGFVLRRFNLDKSKETYEAELSRMNAALTSENQSLQYDNRQLNTLIKDFETTLESVMGTFRNQAKEVQERELSLIREYETKLLVSEEENAARELASSISISESLSRLSDILRQVLKLQTGEHTSSPPSPSSPEAPTASIADEDRERWKSITIAERSLERDIELARLEKENEELRRMLGINPPLRRNQLHQSDDNGDALHGGDRRPLQTGSSEHLPDSSRTMQRQTQPGTAGGVTGPFGTYKRKQSLG